MALYVGGKKVSTRPKGGGSAFGGSPNYSGGSTSGSGTKKDPYKRSSGSSRNSRNDNQPVEVELIRQDAKGNIAFEKATVTPQQRDAIYASRREWQKQQVRNDFESSKQRAYQDVVARQQGAGGFSAVGGGVGYATYTVNNSKRQGEVQPYNKNAFVQGLVTGYTKPATSLKDIRYDRGRKSSQFGQMVGIAANAPVGYAGGVALKVGGTYAGRAITRAAGPKVARFAGQAFTAGAIGFGGYQLANTPSSRRADVFARTAITLPAGVRGYTSRNAKGIITGIDTVNTNRALSRFNTPTFDYDPSVATAVPTSRTLYGGGRVAEQQLTFSNVQSPTTIRLGSAPGRPIALRQITPESFVLTGTPRAAPTTVNRIPQPVKVGSRGQRSIFEYNMQPLERSTVIRQNIGAQSNPWMFTNRRAQFSITRLRPPSVRTPSTRPFGLPKGMLRQTTNSFNRNFGAAIGGARNAFSRSFTPAAVGILGQSIQTQQRAFNAVSGIGASQTQLLAPEQSFRFPTTQNTFQSANTAQSFISAQDQRAATIQTGTFGSTTPQNSFFRPPPNTPSIPTNTPPGFPLIPVIPAIPNFGVGGGSGSRPRSGRGFEYQPSFSAIAYGVTDPKPPKQLRTGFEVRGVRSRKKKRRKK